MIFSLACDIVLIPEDKLAIKAVDASIKLQRYQTSFTLQRNKTYPHLSVYMLQLKRRNIRKAKNLLKTIARDFEKFDLRAKNYFETHNYLDVEYPKNRSMEKLQETVVDAFNPIRHGMRKQDKQRLKTESGLKKDNLQKYGTASIGNLFRPHMTLTRVKGEAELAYKSLPKDIRTFDGKFAKIALMKMGDNGTCTKELYSINLK